jgi:hypothetical protein
MRSSVGWAKAQAVMFEIGAVLRAFAHAHSHC